MGQYKVRHQADTIKIPMHDLLYIREDLTTMNYYIQIDSMDALDRLIEQCRDLKLAMMEEQNGLDER